MIIIAFFFLLQHVQCPDFNQESTPICSMMSNFSLVSSNWNFFVTLLQSFAKHGLPLSPSLIRKIGLLRWGFGLGWSGESYLCSVNAIIWCVLYLQLNSAPPDVQLARLFNSNSHITAIITRTFQDVVTLLGPKLGFLSSDISPHCLCELGAMATTGSDWHRHYSVSWQKAIWWDA